MNKGATKGYLSVATVEPLFCKGNVKKCGSAMVMSKLKELFVV